MPWVAQAKLLLLENKPQEAELAAREAIEQDDGFDRGYTVLGEALFAQGRLEESFVAFRRSTEVGQGYVRAGLVLAAKLHEASRYDEAAAELRKVLNYDPGHPTAKNGLGDIYLIQGRISRCPSPVQGSFRGHPGCAVSQQPGYGLFRAGPHG